jgi:recombinational DNA repair ATPase RecF
MEDLKRIMRLTIRNFVGVEELDFAPGKVNIISGRIGRGKTSILKAIAEALAGGGKRPELIRVTPDDDAAQGKAEIVADLGEVSIRRSITPKGSYLKVEGLPKGATEAAFLEQLVNPLGFNPVAFFQAKPADRRAMLLKLLPCSLDADEVKAQYGMDVDCQQHGLDAAAALEKLLVEERREANAVAEERRARAATLSSQVPPSFDAEKWRAADVSSLNATIRAAGAAEQSLANKRSLVASKRTEQQTKAARIDALAEQIGQLKEQQFDLRDAIATADDEVAVLEAEIAATVLPDASQAQADLDAYTEAQGHLHSYDAAEAAKAALEDATAEAQRLDGLVSQARAIPAQMLEGATLPVDGLAITADDVLLNGVSINLLSTGEQLLFALDIARASVGNGLPVILIDRAESLDPQSFALLMEKMQSDTFQYFVTRVDGGEVLAIDSDGAQLALVAEGGE